MRTLNRPMFRMGGPIKQGIMHGIREPRRGGGRAALVGNPIFPKDASGRAHHNIWASIYGVGSKVLPKAGGIMSRAWNKIKPTSVPKHIKEDMYGLPVGMRGSIKDRVYTRPFMERAGKWVRENPYWTAAGVAGPGQTAAITAAQEGPGLLKRGVMQIGDLLVHDSLWDQDKYFADKAAREELEKNLANKVGKKDYGPYKKSEKATKLKEKTKDDRVNELLEIMGYDKARKNAAYDALIDAGQIINQRGTLSKKNINRELIDPIIAATSKRFDKPQQIEEAVRLLQTKADIEATQPSTKLKDLIAIGIDTPEKQAMYLKSALGQPTTWGGAKSIAAKANLTGDNAISAAASQFADNFQGNLLTTKSLKEIIEAPANKKKKESDIIVEFTEKAVKTKGYPPGDYTVGGVLVTVDENGKVTNITR